MHMLQLTTFGILMALSGFTPSQSSPILAPQSETPIVEEARGAAGDIAKISRKVSEDDIEGYVRETFKEEPILAEVAQCESNFRQFGKDGYALRGIVDKRDIGVMQINEGYHLQTANKLGHNIYTLEGNLDYAKFLYEKFGLSPWKASSKCWTKSLEIAMR